MSLSRPTVADVFDAHELTPKDREQLEFTFFRRLRMQNGSKKSTYARRMDDLNAKLAALLPRDQILDVMDVAVSSGISTGELVEALKDAGVEHQLLAGDLYVRAGYFRTKGFGVLVDASGYPLLFEAFGHGFPVGMTDAPRRPVVYQLRALLHRFAESLVKGHRGFKDFVANPDKAPSDVRALQLISPRLLDQVKVIEDDIGEERPELRGRFDCLRAANILNRSYFDDDLLKRMIAVLKGRLKPNGVLAVCSTDIKRVNHGTIYRIAGDGSVTELDRLGDGCAVDDLIRSTP